MNFIPSFTPFVVDNNTNAYIQLLSPSANAQAINFGDADDSDVGQISYLHASNQMLFTVNAQEAMRIDSSGNVLVGKTASGLANTGAELRSGSSNHALTITSDSEIPMLVNRKTNNGDLVRFYKDGSTVGNIGIQSSGFYIDGEATV